jgi:hypothetical protein
MHDPLTIKLLVVLLAVGVLHPTATCRLRLRSC